MELFYTRDIKESSALLSREESRHAVKVMRLKRGDNIEFTDGQGTFYNATIEEADPDACLLSISERIIPPQRSYKIHIAIAPTKNIDRFEWFLEKATEFGIDTVTPLLTKRSERDVIKPERLEKILISAMKQSGQAMLPALSPMQKLKDFLKNIREPQKFIAHCMPGEEKKTLFSSCKKDTDTLVLIGPEGDFNEEEIRMATDNGLKPVSLGSTRLRTETAGLAAVQSIHFVNGI